jgi:hypothetical protein
MLYENVFSLKLVFAKHFITAIIFYACGSKVKNYLQKFNYCNFCKRSLALVSSKFQMFN